MGGSENKDEVFEVCKAPLKQAQALLESKDNSVSKTAPKCYGRSRTWKKLHYSPGPQTLE